MTTIYSVNNYERAFNEVKRLAQDRKYDEATRAAINMGPAVCEDISDGQIYIDECIRSQEVFPLIQKKQYQQANSFIGRIATGDIRNEAISRLVEHMLRIENGDDAIRELKTNNNLYCRLDEYIRDKKTTIECYKQTPSEKETQEMTRGTELLKICQQLPDSVRLG